MNRKIKIIHLFQIWCCRYVALIIVIQATVMELAATSVLMGTSGMAQEINVTNVTCTANSVMTVSVTVALTLAALRTFSTLQTVQQLTVLEIPMFSAPAVLMVSI